MTRYAENTSVSVENSKAEIERTLHRYGADQFASGWKENSAHILFRLNNRFVRLDVFLPEKNSAEFQRTPGRGNHRTEEKAYRAWEQACRQRWRALALAIKAKLEACEAGITDFESEFLAHIVLPDQKTVAQHIKPEIEKAYQTGKLPPLLPGF